MTLHQALAMRVRQLLSEEADDYGAENIELGTQLRADLNLSGVQRVSLAYRLEAEFAVRFDEAAFDAVVDRPNATACDVLNVIERLTQQAHA